jgi:hypothetical protein
MKHAPVKMIVTNFGTRAKVIIGLLEFYVPFEVLTKDSVVILLGDEKVVTEDLNDIQPVFAYLSKCVDSIRSSIDFALLEFEDD